MCLWVKPIPSILITTTKHFIKSPSINGATCMPSIIVYLSKDQTKDTPDFSPMILRVAMPVNSKLAGYVVRLLRLSSRNTKTTSPKFLRNIPIKIPTTSSIKTIPTIYHVCGIISKSVQIYCHIICRLGCTMQMPHRQYQLRWRPRHQPHKNS